MLLGARRRGWATRLDRVDYACMLHCTSYQCCINYVVIPQLLISVSSPPHLSPHSTMKVLILLAVVAFACASYDFSEEWEAWREVGRHTCHTHSIHVLYVIPSPPPLPPSPPHRSTTRSTIAWKRRSIVMLSGRQTWSISTHTMSTLMSLGSPSRWTSLETW